ncbi:hypothetical protein Saso_51660 [Streptomyces asoensis]|uniref:Aminotransferase class I/classII domain-containing protein n=1 Tax=Streptomyces asoensis TaxID=249586 RepID=A0ABQ3S5W9_9ACTN|nr:hypothetical protein GCM10010496_49970 [Streptomyces asoensis]GHI63516.1 hypothetical protein Saso_51660 [Streptomyces asoensis]
MGRTVRSGAVSFEVLSGSVPELTRTVAERHGRILERLRTRLDWRLDPPFAPQADGCEHGGAFFSAIGTDFRTLTRRHEVVAADVLDAWFPPSPEARAILAEDPGCAARTSPPTGAEGLLAEIAGVRGLPVESLVVGAGSSDLIFRAFGRWLTPRSRVLLLDPGYGEYAHVTERVIGCRVGRLRRHPRPHRLTPRRSDGAAGAGVSRGPTPSCAMGRTTGSTCPRPCDHRRPGSRYRHRDTDRSRPGRTTGAFRVHGRLIVRSDLIARRSSMAA